MPLYEFQCTACNAVDDWFMSIAEMEKLRDCQRCRKCGGQMEKLISIPALKTDTRFFAGMGDGFGKDDFSRKIALQRARAAGVSTAGMTYFPQLCPKGDSFSPEAWCKPETSEIKRKLTKLGRGAEGSINVKVPEREEKKRPYRVADNIVEGEARLVAKREKLGKLTPKEKTQLRKDVRKRITGNFTEPV